MRKLLLLSAVLASFLSRSLEAQDDPNRVTVPRWLDPPQVDGQCSEPAYLRGEKLVLRGAGRDLSAVAVHSSLDLYLCILDLDPGAQVAVGLDPDRSGDGEVGIGDAVFRFSANGEVRAEQGDGEGKLVALPIGPRDAAGKILEAGGRGTAEIRVSLEWLGGYARTAGLGVAVEAPGGSVLDSWPPGADVRSPGSWGEAELAPRHATGTAAGSVFLDGREGYVVIPWAPELNPQEITVEAWVRAVDGDCGTLVGNGQAKSYWLALCDGLRFGHAGASTVRGVAHPLGNGWHHAAFTFDNRGIRTLYVDGAVVLQPGWEAPYETDSEEEEEVRTPVRLGRSTLPLRIGADRDGPGDLGGESLHGYVRELRIWNRARSEEEIRDSAFEALHGSEPGLVGLWPFTSDLADRAGGHDAGLVGNAALAREAPKVTAFPAPPAIPETVYPKPPARPAWEKRIPAAADDKAMMLDGNCARAEYARATRLPLEPDRSLQMKVLVTGEALYLCTQFLAGQADGKSAVTLWLDRDGKPAAQPGPSELRIRLAPDGQLLVGSGNVLGYTGAAPAGIQAKVTTGSRLRAQEDLFAVEAPWWSGEIRIPLAALAPFVPGTSLRLALAYDGTAPAGSGLPALLRATWPASFQELRSDTWGLAATDKPSAAAGSFGNVTRALISPLPRTPINTERALETATPRPSPPRKSDFDGRCDAFPLAYATSEDAKWPLVDENRPVAQVSGVLTKVYVSAQDSAFIHESHDVDMKLTLRPEDRWTSLTTNTLVSPPRSTGGGPNLVLETESLGFPPHHDRDQGARPTVGDHVTVLGRWIFDCGHEPKTEIHPIPLFASDRLEVRPLWKGGPQRTVRMVRVWMNSDPEPFGYEFTGPFTFEVELPPEGWSPFLRVNEGDESRVTSVLAGDRMRISVDPPDRTGTFYFEMMVGHLVQPEDGLSRSSRTATMGSWELEVLDDHDHGFPPDCFSISATEDCGEIYYAVNVNGRWRQLFWDETIASGQRRGVLDTFPISGPNLQLQVTGYEEDGPFSAGGDALSPDPNIDPANDGEGGFDLGPLDQISGQRTLDAPGGDWRLHYQVTPGGELPPSLVDQPFWSPRLDAEPNDRIGTSLGRLPVPGSGGAPITTSRNGFLTEPSTTGTGFGEITLFAPDIDRYRFDLADFADVEIPSLSAPLLLTAESWNPWHTSGSLPPMLKTQLANGQTLDRATSDVIGFAGARLRVASTDGRAGDRPYTLSVRTRYRTVAPDWGESRDSQGGRTIDLATLPPLPGADPRLRREAQSQWEAESRNLAADWAWQHVAADADTYRLILPPVPAPPPGHTSCQFDALGRLVVRAFPMSVSISALGVSGAGVVVAGNLRQSLPNGGPVTVQVTASGLPRRLYQLEAEWEGSRYFTPSECEELRQSMRDLRALTPRGELELLKGILAFQRSGVPAGPFPWPGPDPAPTELPPLGDFRAVRVENGGPLDLIVSSPESQPVVARLFDGLGVLVGESAGLDEATAVTTRAPAGLVPQTRLRAEGLAAGETYLLQVVPRDAATSNQKVPLGFEEVRP